MLTIPKTINKRLTCLLIAPFSNKHSSINATPPHYQEQRLALHSNVWRTPDPTHKKSFETHLSNGEEMIHRTPVVYTDMAVVRCLGGTQIGPGHPQVYIQLNTKTPGEPVSCKYCGMRYALKHHH